MASTDETSADTEAMAAITPLLGLQAEILRAMSHPARLQILQLLRNGERCVCEIEPALGLRQPNVSQHLAILRSAGLVVSRRDGLRVLYRATDPVVFQIMDLVTEVLRRQGSATAEVIARGAPEPVAGEVPA